MNKQDSGDLSFEVAYSRAIWASAGPRELRALTDAIGNPVFVIGVEADGRFRLLSLNAYHERVTGLWHEQVSGRYLDELLPAGIADTLAANYRRCVQLCKRLEYEEHLPLPAGERWWQTVLTPVLDASGRVVRIIGSGIDVTARKLVEQALRRNEEQLALFFAQSLDGFFFMMLDRPLAWGPGCDREGGLDYAFAQQRMTRVNQALLAQYRVEEQDMLGCTPAQLFAHDQAAGRRLWAQLFDQGRLHVETREQRRDGTPIWIEGDYICLYDEAGRITGHFGVQRDVTDRREAEARLRESEERLQLALTGGGLGTWDWNVQEGTVRFDERLAGMLGLRAADLGGRPEGWRSRVHPQDLPRVEQALDAHFRGETANYQVEHRLRHADGHWVWVLGSGKVIERDAEGLPLRACGTHQDITARKQAEEELRELTAALRYRAVHDSLTGVLNRGAIIEALERELERAVREGGRVSVGIVDIDHFKAVNDTYGHQTGDAVLQQAVRRMQAQLRSYDSLGRYGGEEFLIVAAGPAQELYERVRAALADTPVETRAGPVEVTASIGAAVCSGCCDARALLAEADAALYRAKRGGRNRVELAAAPPQSAAG